MTKRSTTVAASLLTPDDVGPGAVRILHWLARYPLQRAEDLEIALHHWHKRASVYRYLGRLEEEGLVETLRPAATQGKLLYHLSPPGFIWCQAHSHSEMQTPATFQAQKETLVRLLPRLPALLTLQNFVNGLATGAASMLTQKGRRADLVRWDWERDFTHPFFYRERPTRMQVDGAVALCLRFEEAAGPPQEIWHTLFFLYNPLLDDVRLMRQRLERVLRWRESAERWPVYSQMPPLLILTTSFRQAEWWQRATEQATSSLRVDLPRGAVACWPAACEDRGTMSPWLLPWKALGTNASCTIQQFLHPLPPSAIQALVTPRTCTADLTRQEQAASSLGEPAGETRRRRIRRSYGLAAFCADSLLPDSGKQKQEDFRLTSVRLVPRMWEILYLCLAHPLLNQEDLAGLLGLESSSVRLLLVEVHKVGYLVGEESVAGLRWRLTEAGLRLLAQAVHCHVRHLGFFPDDPNAPLQQRGLRGRLREIRHTAGVYGFFATLASALRSLPNAGLSWWETGWICERRFSYKEQPYSLRPDGLAAYQIGGNTLRFWLEWDRGTMNARDLQVKFATYGAYLVAREWTRGDTVPPALLCVAPDIAQEQVLVRVAQAKLVSQPASFLYTTTAHLLVREGMLAPIWRQEMFGHQRSSANGENRCSVFTDLWGKKYPPPP